MRNRTLLVLLGLTAIAAVILWTMEFKLKTPKAPLGSISLQLSWDEPTGNCIVKSWSDDQKRIANQSLMLDYLFIVLYCATLVVVIKKLFKTSGLRMFLLVASILAALSDIVENILMQSFLQHLEGPVHYFSLAASFKFILLAIVLVFVVFTLYLRLKARLELIGHLFAALRINTAGLIVLLVCYFLFINLTQGQDVIMQIAEATWASVFSILSILFLTHVLWYSARLITYEKKSQYLKSNYDDADRDPYLIHTPRLISFNILVFIQAAIFALPTTAKFSELQLWIFVAVQNSVYLLWIQWQTTKIKWTLFTVAGISVSYLALVLWTVKGQKITPVYWLPWIAMVLYLYSICIVSYFVWRREKLNPSKVESKDTIIDLRFLGVKFINLPFPLPKTEQSSFKMFSIISMVAVTIYVLAVLVIQLDTYIGPFAFALLAFGVLAGFSNMITVVSLRNKTNIFILLLLLALLVGKLYDPYYVRTLACEPGPKRPDLITYFNRWLDHRGPLLEKSDTFPVYVVIADGGASRSGYWVASVLSKLQDNSIAAFDTAKNKFLFSDHLFCLAGASGGSVGNATFYALLKNRKLDDPETFLRRSANFLSQDFLTPVLTRWFGSDFFQHLIPMPFIDDRGGALEIAMENFSQDSLYGSFGKPFLDQIDTTGSLPVLFINSTHMQSGSPAVVSSINLDSVSQRVDIIDSLQRDMVGIRYSTAVVLGARFHYASPAGRIGTDYFVDGGYFDNTGAGIVHEMLQYLDSVMEANPKNNVYQKLRFSVLYISNYSIRADSTSRINPLSNDIAAPILTVLGTYSSQTSVNNERLKTFVRRRFNKVNPFHEINLYTKDDTIEYPMNWVISDYNRKRMDDRTKTFMDKRDLEFFGRN